MTEPGMKTSVSRTSRT